MTAPRSMAAASATRPRRAASAQRASGVRTHPGRPQGAVRQPQLHTRIAGLKKTRAMRCWNALPPQRDAGIPLARFALAAQLDRFWTTAPPMHHAMWDYFPHKRLGYRVTVKATEPFYRA